MNTSLSLSAPNLLPPGILINGSWQQIGPQFDVINPQDFSVIASVADAGSEHALLAIDAAEQALRSWRQTVAAKRSALLLRWSQLVLQHADDLAKIIHLEQGKPLAQAHSEVKRSAEYISHFAEEAKRIRGEVVNTPSQDQQGVCLQQAVGVVAAITPWNFPSSMVARKLAPAIAAGCTVVLKPAQETPLSALALAELANRAGIPAGVLNVLPCAQPQSVAQVLCSDSRVAKLSFTGSTAVGKKLASACGAQVKPLTLELGGNAPFIVFADADINKAVADLVDSKFRNAGQTCISPNRILVAKPIYQQFIQRLEAALQTVQCDNLVSQPGATEVLAIGPLIHRQAVHKVQALVDDAVAKGAQLRLGGEVLAGGCYFMPTLLSEVNDSMAIFSSEIFAPVLALTCFTDEAQAISLANNSEHGLAAYFYTQDLARAWRVGALLNCGMVAVNAGAVSNIAAPFGGVKASGYGKEGSHQGIEAFLDTKYLQF